MPRLAAISVLAMWTVLGQAGPTSCIPTEPMTDMNENGDDSYENQDQPFNDNDQPAGDDADRDGIVDAEDNCPNVSNPTQEDLDNDGVGNSCDNCPDVPNKDQANADGDLSGDLCDEFPDIHDDELDDGDNTNGNVNDNDNQNENINDNDNDNGNENDNETENENQNGNVNDNENDNTSMAPELVPETFTIEPDDYENETELTNINEYVLLNTADDENSIFSLFDVTADTDGQGLAPTGEKVFGHANIPFFNNARRLRMDFPSPAMEVQITFGGGTFFETEIGRLEVYDSLGNLIDEYITQPLEAGESEVMNITRDEADIFVAIAYIADGEGDFGRLDELIFTVLIAAE